MRLGTLALSSIAALLVGASMAVATTSIPIPRATTSIPIPTEKPLFFPQWLLNCLPTRLALAKLDKGDAELLYSAPLSSLNRVSVTGQIWGTPMGSAKGDGKDGGNQWWVIVHSSSGMSCMVSRGTHIPKWVTEIDGIRS